MGDEEEVDSNDEGYYANDYPEEPSDVDEEEEEDGGGMIRRGSDDDEDEEEEELMRDMSFRMQAATQRYVCR